MLPCLMESEFSNAIAEILKSCASLQNPSVEHKINCRFCVVYNEKNLLGVGMLLGPDQD